MQPVRRNDWIEWLDALDLKGTIDITETGSRTHADAAWRLRNADYDPFDDVVEIVLEDGVGSLRVLLDAPTAIEFVGAPQAPERIVISTEAGPFEISNVRRHRPHQRRHAAKHEREHEET